MADIPVRPHRKTLMQTALILNVSVRTVRRYLENGRLRWSGGQVSLESIIEELQRSKEDEKQAQGKSRYGVPTRRIISPGI